jgi:hypothetical protein
MSKSIRTIQTSRRTTVIKSHEQQLELRLPRIGVIRKGAPKPERGPGRDLDYFRLDRAEQSVVAAWNEALGREPKAISGILPYADPAENLSIWDELWQGKRLLWRGDGERLHVKLDGNAYVRYTPGEGPAQPAAAGDMVDKLKVARISHLRILLPQLRIAGIFEIMSSSAIDADELWANMMWIRSTVATLQGAPVTVFRAARQFNVQQGDKTMAVTKHMLHMMLDGRYLEALLPSPVTGAPQLAPVQPPPAMASGIEDDAPEIDEGDYEEAPPVTALLYEDGSFVADHPKTREVYAAYVEAHNGKAPANRHDLKAWHDKQTAAPVEPVAAELFPLQPEPQASAFVDPA